MLISLQDIVIRTQKIMEIERKQLLIQEKEKKREEQELLRKSAEAAQIALYEDDFDEEISKKRNRIRKESQRNKPANAEFLGDKLLDSKLLSGKSESNKLDNNKQK